MQRKYGQVDNAEIAKRLFLRGKHLGKEGVKGLGRELYAFAFVRNPYSRIASAYLDKVARGKGRQARVLGSRGHEKSTPFSFLEFCQYIREVGPYEDPHWFPQVAFIPCGKDKLNFLGVFENLEADYSVVENAIFGGNSFSLCSSWDDHKTNASQWLRDTYCEETLHIVGEVYKDDFSSFSYKKFNDLESARFSYERT